jgi:hypothetical protein
VCFKALNLNLFEKFAALFYYGSYTKKNWKTVDFLKHRGYLDKNNKSCIFE